MDKARMNFLVMECRYGSSDHLDSPRIPTLLYFFVWSCGMETLLSQRTHGFFLTRYVLRFYVCQRGIMENVGLDPCRKCLGDTWPMLDNGTAFNCEGCTNSDDSPFNCLASVVFGGNCCCCCCCRRWSCCCSKSSASCRINRFTAAMVALL